MARRPILLDPVAVEAHAAKGLAEYQIAAALGVSQDTFAARKKEQPGVADALTRGKQAAIGEIENAMFECAKLARTNPKYQTSAIFWLKCNAGWKERTVVETVTHEDDATARGSLLARINALAVDE